MPACMGRPGCVTGQVEVGSSAGVLGGNRLGCGVIGSLACGFLRLAGLGVPGEHGGDDEGAFGHMVRDLELQVHGSDLGGVKTCVP